MNTKFLASKIDHAKFFVAGVVLIAAHSVYPAARMAAALMRLDIAGVIMRPITVRTTLTMVTRETRIGAAVHIMAATLLSAECGTAVITVDTILRTNGAADNAGAAFAAAA